MTDDFFPTRKRILNAAWTAVSMMVVAVTGSHVSGLGAAFYLFVAATLSMWASLLPSYRSARRKWNEFEDREQMETPCDMSDYETDRLPKFRSVEQADEWVARRMRLTSHERDLSC